MAAAAAIEAKAITKLTSPSQSDRFNNNDDENNNNGDNGSNDW